MSETVKPGVETSEYKETQSAKVWGLIAVILGFITTSLAPVLSAIGVTEGSTAGIVAGAMISCAGLLYRTFIQLGYIKSRSDVKVNANAGITE